MLERIEKLSLLRVKMLYTAKDLCLITGITASQVRKMVDKNEIPYILIGCHTYFKKDDIEAWIKESRVKSNRELVLDTAIYDAMRMVEEAKKAAKARQRAKSKTKSKSKSKLKSQVKSILINQIQNEKNYNQENVPC